MARESPAPAPDVFAGNRLDRLWQGFFGPPASLFAVFKGSHETPSERLFRAPGRVSRFSDARFPLFLFPLYKESTRTTIEWAPFLLFSGPVRVSAGAVFFIWVFFPQQLKALGSQPRWAPAPGWSGAAPRQGSMRVPPQFHEVLRGLRGGATAKKGTACCWEYHLSFFFFCGGGAGCALVEPLDGFKRSTRFGTNLQTHLGTYPCGHPTLIFPEQRTLASALLARFEVSSHGQLHLI